MREGGDEAVEFAVQWDALDGLLAVSLKCSTKIVQRDTGDLCHGPVGNAAGQARVSQVSFLFSRQPLTISNPSSSFSMKRDLGGVVLQIPIHGDDDISSSGVEASLECGGLTEVPP